MARVGTSTPRRSFYAACMTPSEMGMMRWRHLVISGNLKQAMALQGEAERDTNFMPVGLRSEVGASWWLHIRQVACQNFRMRTHALFVVISATLPATASAADTFLVQGGTLYLARPLANIGKNGSGAVLTPDGKTAYFVRSIADPEVAKQWDGEATQICRVGVGTGDIEPLVEPAGSSKPEDNLRGFSNLVLSPDSRNLYFLSAAWATSNAIHALNLSTGVVSFVSPGNEIFVIRTGEYRGNLVMQKHKYFVGGGSYDQYWAVSPEGKELGLAGENRAQVQRLLR